MRRGQLCFQFRYYWQNHNLINSASFKPGISFQNVDFKNKLRVQNNIITFNIILQEEAAFY